jgi:glutamate racemase
VKREYTKALIRDFGQGCEVTLVGSAHLAGIAEAALRGEPVDDAAIATELAPCFVDRDGRRTDTVALACTHFPLLLASLERLAPWPVAWIDPAPAIARRVVDLIGKATQDGGRPGRAIFTSGRAPTPALARALNEFGLSTALPVGAV